MFARGGDEEVTVGEGLVGVGVPLDGVGGKIDDGQMGIGLVGYPEGGEVGPPLCVVMFAKNLICSVVIWQKLRKAGARIWLMRSRFTSRLLPSYSR